MFIHDWVVASLEERLIESGKYTFVDCLFEYNRGKYHGEVDVLSYRHDNNTYYFWEIKRSYGSKQREKAQSQYEKFCAAYPQKKVKGIMVTKDGIYLLKRK